ncbi:MAG: hypothetical protein AAGA83_14795, partial [Cyanobacteria bacterium P01_F01_bin.116]
GNSSSSASNGSSAPGAPSDNLTGPTTGLFGQSNDSPFQLEETLLINEFSDSDLLYGNNIIIEPQEISPVMEPSILFGFIFLVCAMPMTRRLEHRKGQDKDKC